MAGAVLFQTTVGEIWKKNLPSMCLEMPAPVFIPLKSATAAEGFRNCLQWIIWPHEVFSSLYNHADNAAQIVDDTDRDTPPYDDTAQVADSSTKKKD